MHIWDLLDDRLNGFRNLAGLQDTSGKARQNEIDQTIECVVDQVDPRIRIIGGYKRKLRKAVQIAADYLDQLAKHIPSNIAVNRTAFGVDPRVKAFFSSVDEMQQIFSRDSNVRKFFSDESNLERDHCHALLCMNMNERTVLGMTAENNMLQRDVEQTQVWFSDHQIVAATASQAQTRAGFTQCSFNFLLDLAKKEITQSRSEYRQELEKRSDQNPQSEKDSGMPADQEQDESSVSGQIVSTESERSDDQISQLKLVAESPAEHLHILLEILSHPDEQFDLNPVQLFLNSLGVKLNDAQAKDYNNIELMELRSKEHFKHVVAVVSFPRSELIPESKLFQKF